MANPPPAPTDGDRERAHALLCVMVGYVTTIDRDLVAGALADERSRTLEDAAQLADSPYSDAVAAFAADEPSTVGCKIAAAIRALANPAKQTALGEKEGG